MQHQDDDRRGKAKRWFRALGIAAGGANDEGASGTMRLVKNGFGAAAVAASFFQRHGACSAAIDVSTGQQKMGE